MEIEDIVRNFAQARAGEEELHPTPGAIVDADGETLLALDLSAEQTANLGFSLCRNLNVKEFFLSFDCHNEREPLHPIYHSVLVIFHVCKGDVIRLGAMSYGWDLVSSTPVVGAVHWNDPFWSAKHEKLLLHLARQCTGAGVMIGIEREDRPPVRLN
ncbi:MAG: hypothetical protein KAJ19_24245 [Gammaproteobacteria bacterium]|nr:hypothetical protein [Gammaproteobacteria bacterium]